jgi:hypothetical protein
MWLQFTRLGGLLSLCFLSKMPYSCLSKTTAASRVSSLNAAQEPALITAHRQLKECASTNELTQIFHQISGPHSLIFAQFVLSL